MKCGSQKVRFIMTSKSKLFCTIQKAYRICQLSELCPASNSSDFSFKQNCSDMRAAFIHAIKLKAATNIKGQYASRLRACAGAVTAIRLPCCGPVMSRKIICNPDVTDCVGFRLTYPRSDRLLTKRIAGREIHPREYVNNNASLRYFIVRFHSSPQRLPYKCR